MRGSVFSIFILTLQFLGFEIRPPERLRLDIYHRTSHRVRFRVAIISQCPAFLVAMWGWALL
jgi:hypothetical protein